MDLLRDNGKFVSGLVSVRGSNDELASLSIDERAAVSEAAAFKEVDFVYFRRFSDTRSSHVAAYVVDNSDERLNEKALAELHRQLWLHGVAPIVYVASATRVDVLTCARGPDFWVREECRYRPVAKLLADSITAASVVDTELRRRFSALRLSDGTFWEDDRNRRLSNYDKAAHQLLIQAVVEADRSIDGDASPVLRRLLLLMVLIKYLEDRNVFPSDWFGQFHKGARSFFDVLAAGEPAEVLRLLRVLERKFNGDVFVLPTDPENNLTKKALRNFARLVEARTIRRQRYLWDQFSFQYVPVEVISHLYQRFVRGGHGAVYTPSFLASLLLDHAMPYNKLKGDERVLDPSCGSGVFLVGAFRRLTTFWRSQHSWRRPSVKVLKRILRKCIFGVELDSNAVDLAAFSLALAVCDSLKPDVVWRDLRFDQLREINLMPRDFFELIIDAKNGKDTILRGGFDVIVGNPPFESELTPAGVEVDKVAQRETVTRGPLPDQQAAYLFLDQAISTLNPKGRLCLIQPSPLFYNSKAHDFRRSVLCKSQTNSVLDFTSIRGLYHADAKTVAVSIVANAPCLGHHIEHSTFRRTISVRQRICFELDHYDRHRIPQECAESDQFVWRANLLGGGRLLEMSKRIRRMRNLAGYVAERGWDYGEGFIAAKSGKRTPAPFLTGRPFLPTAAFTDAGIDETEICEVTDTRFRSAYTKDRYSAPLVMIKELQSLPIAYRETGFLGYRDKIVGIHAPRSEARELRALYNALRTYRETYQFCCALNGTQSLVGKATAILKQDIDLLPYPEDQSELAFACWEEALQQDVLHYMMDYVRLGQKSELLQRGADAKDMDAYSWMYCRMLGSVYEGLHSTEPICLDGLICQPFYFGERPLLDWLSTGDSDNLRKLVYHKKHAHLRTVRVLRFYAENVILIVKPDRLRYWIRSTAVRDADETIADLARQGY